MSLWKLEEIFFLITNVSKCLLLTYMEDLFFPSSRQVLSADLHNPKKLSELIKKDVVSVVDREEKISLGAGGTGTTRFALTANLRDGTTEHLFCKVPSLSVFERLLLTVFKVYENEIRFYDRIRKLMPDLADKSAQFPWCPKVHYAK